MDESRAEKIIRLAAAEVAKHIPKDEIFRRLAVYNESHRIVEIEIPELLEWVDYKIPSLPLDLESRLRRFNDNL